MRVASDDDDEETAALIAEHREYIKGGPRCWVCGASFARSTKCPTGPHTDDETRIAMEDS